MVVGNEDLDRLEGMVGRFNVFEALGVVAQEVRHSDFLAFLLDPRGSHGLGDLFTKRFLQAALAQARRAGRPAPLSLVDLDVMDLSGAEVARERHRIDVLLIDEHNRLAVAVENKIWAGEGEGQLVRYLRVVEEGYPSWRHLFLYLTPHGEEASRPEYLSVGYGVVRDVAEAVLASRGEGMDPALAHALRHYSQVLGRHVIGDSEIAELCKKIYRKHRRALDLIYEHRPDRQDEIREILIGFVGEVSVLKPEDSTKGKVRFAVAEWDTSITMAGPGWTSSRRLLIFEWANDPDKLSLKLVLGPGDQETRHRLHAVASSAGRPFKVAKGLGAYWNTLYSRTWLTKADLAEKEIDELEPKLREQWRRFVERDLPQIDAALKNQEWLWERD